MKKFIQKYSIAIIVILGFLLACKSCQSCSKSRQFDASATKSEAVIDSIKNINKELTLQNKLSICGNPNFSQDERIKALNDAKNLMEK